MNYDLPHTSKIVYCNRKYATTKNYKKLGKILKILKYVNFNLIELIYNLIKMFISKNKEKNRNAMGILDFSY